MTQAMPRTRAKRTTLGAALIFGLAYLGALLFIFAPEGMLSSRTTAVQSITNP